MNLKTSVDRRSLASKGCGWRGARQGRATRPGAPPAVHATSKRSHPEGERCKPGNVLNGQGFQPHGKRSTEVFRLNRTLSRTALLLAVWSATALAHERHVHGEGKLNVAIDGGVVTLELELPLDVTVGFEHAPQSDKKKAALAAAAETLGNAAALWALTPAAGCRVESARVGLPEFKGEHADVDARYVFRCRHPAALTAVETTLFKAFGRLHRIEVQRIGPTGQGAARLTPTNPILRW
ncbi:DUF2796 domain-containing protein [Methyloversatilis discipulorum]|uniref:DUF2796 domain-containing protein n=1 Tax=Methyloversatilis discipulorum TaxID=1119528 RepID=UPI001A5F79F8|nr:DUF2796 domain-containing protein [Methyloversatilis discipulorum]MBL8466221.1 DUF2796 domain-containing protein [Methyloversatilis discipulorum]